MKYLVIGPGGQGAFAILGHLKKIENELCDVEEISGASSGSIIAALMCIGKTIDEIFNIFLETDMSPMNKLDLNTFLTTYGFIKTDYIQEHIIHCLGDNLTFRQVSKKLYISALCVTTGQTEYFSKDTHPDMHISEAVRMSSSVPVLMSAHTFQGKIYADGGILETVPAFPFLGKLSNDVWCVSVSSLSSSQCAKIDNFKEYMIAIINSYMKCGRISYNNFPIVHIDAAAFNLIDFAMSYEDKVRLFILGNKFPCILKQDEPPLWSENKYKCHKSHGDYEIVTPSEYSPEQDKDTVV